MVRRRIFAILSASSLMLCVATLGAWARSYHVSDWVEYVHDHRMEPGRRLIFLNSDSGRFALGTGILVWHEYTYTGGFTFWHSTPSRRPPAYWDEPEGDPDDSSPPPLPPWWTRLGFGVQHILQNDCSSDNQITIAAPHWFIVILTSLLPMLWLKRFRLGLGRAQGICKRCRYDLRATPDRCPKCGAVPLGKIRSAGGV